MFVAIEEVLTAKQGSGNQKAICSCWADSTKQSVHAGLIQQVL